MRGALTSCVLALAMAGLAGCGHAARPPVLAEADHEPSTAAAREAAVLAPQAIAHAEKLRSDALAASDAGDAAAAQFLGERAVAAYRHAYVLARLARAEAGADAAERERAAAERRLAELDAEQARAAAALADVEGRLAVLRDAPPIVAPGRADGPREGARLAAARAFVREARLLCAAATVLGPKGDAADAVARSTKEAVELDAALASAPRVTPIDAATRARAACLAALTLVRRDVGAGAATGRADALLEELSRAGGLDPSRDERGIVVVLRGKLDDKALPAPLAARVAAFARVAAAHPEVPVQVAVHGAKAASAAGRAKLEARGRSVANALAAGSVSSERVHVELVPGAEGALDAASAADRGRAERIELVLVAPGG